MKDSRFRALTLFILLILISLAFVPALGAPPIPPSAPKNLTGECVNGKVVLHWEPSVAPEEHPVVWYYIYRGLSSGNESYYAKVDASVTSYIDSNVKPGNTYYYYVTAVNDIGQSNRSNEVNVTVKVVINPPEPPRGLFAIRGNGYVYLEWKPPVYNGGAPIVAYKIYRNDKVIASLSPGITHYNDTSVNITQKYVYYVTAMNKAGESDPSNKVTVVWTMPQPPRDVKVVDMNNYVILSWLPGDSGGLKIEEYRIYEKQNGKWKLLGTTTKNTFKVNLPYSMFGGTLEIKITEVTKLGESKGAIVRLGLPSDMFMVSLIIVLIALIAVLGILMYRRKMHRKS